LEDADQIGASRSEPSVSSPADEGLWLAERSRLTPAEGERRGARPRLDEERALCLSGWIDGAAMYASAHPARESAMAPPTRIPLLEPLLDAWRSVIQDISTLTLPLFSRIWFSLLLGLQDPGCSPRSPRTSKYGVCELQCRSLCFRNAREELSRKRDRLSVDSLW